MARFGLCGPSYQSQSPNVDAERTINLYPEKAEVPSAKSALPLYPSPGSKVFCTLSERSVPGGFAFNGRMFSAGANFYEIFADGTKTTRGNLVTPQGPVSIKGSPNQLLILSAGQLFVFNLTTNKTTRVDMTQFPGTVTQIGYLDGFFLAMIPTVTSASGVSQLMASNSLDGTTWAGDSVTSVSEFPDNLVSMAVDHREIWLLGNKKSVVYYNAGNIPFPFSPIPGSLMESGCAAPAATCQLDNSLFWIELDERGQGVARRANGYSPMRVSNHGVENIWATYPTVTDAIGYPMQFKGHLWWHIYFPSANASWRYDVATGMWHEVAYWDGTSGQFQAHHSMWHAFVFNKHLAGDWSSGNIYELSDVYLDDAGNALRRVRRGPPISIEGQWVFHRFLYVDAEAGLASFSTPSGPRGAQIMARWSDDGTKTWSNEHWIDCGQQGKYKTRPILRRLGRSRNRIYEISMTDAAPWRIADAYLEADPAYKPTKRLAQSMGEMA